MIALTNAVVLVVSRSGVPVSIIAPFSMRSRMRVSEDSHRFGLIDRLRVWGQKKRELRLSVGTGGVPAVRATRTRVVTYSSAVPNDQVVPSTVIIDIN